MSECWNCGATADDNWSCQACRTERGLAQDLADAGREIERLRADNAAMREALVNWQTEAEMEQARRRRLQALIDAWAMAVLSWGPGEPMPDALVAAEHALLAAATKEDDHD